MHAEVIRAFKSFLITGIDYAERRSNSPESSFYHSNLSEEYTTDLYKMKKISCESGRRRRFSSGSGFVSAFVAVHPVSPAERDEDGNSRFREQSGTLTQEVRALKLIANTENLCSRGTESPKVVFDRIAFAVFSFLKKVARNDSTKLIFLYIHVRDRFSTNRRFYTDKGE